MNFNSKIFTLRKLWTFKGEKRSRTGGNGKREIKEEGVRNSRMPMAHSCGEKWAVSFSVKYAN